MIPQIEEINFPSYATLSTATATLVDMGDKTITTQIKIDGSIVPDFSYDWEIEFQGERYIHPLREPQASKGNESMSSLIDLTFYHKGIYDLKRHFFVEIATTTSGTAIASNYIVPLNLDLGKFIKYLNEVLTFYYGNTYKVILNPDFEYDDTDTKEVDINYTYIWDVITRLNEWYGVRWQMTTYQGARETYAIFVGYYPTEVSHIFKYGFEGGLLKFERQVQDAEIRNRMFGRGGSQNLPYRYFKKADVDSQGNLWNPDPDWIPELEDIYFSELRGKSFRDYVRGWKAKHYNGTKYPSNDAYDKGYNDDKFDPIDYVEDKDSIAKYGILQGGLDNNEEIYPTIQKRDLGNGMGRADEIVDVETILVDEPTSNTSVEAQVADVGTIMTIPNVNVWDNDSYNIQSETNVFRIPDGHNGAFIGDFKITAIQRSKCYISYYKYGINMELVGDETKEIEHDLDYEVSDVYVIDAKNNTKINDIANIKGGTLIKVKYTIRVSNFLRRDSKIIKDYKGYIGIPINKIREVETLASIILTPSWVVDYTPFNGQILGNYIEGANRISKSIEIGKGKDGNVVLETKEFEVGENGATSVDVPTRIISTDTTGSYTKRTTINAVNLNTDEVLDPSNLPQGRYMLRVQVDITNNSTASQTYKVELLPAYIYYPYDSAKWRPTFDIWIKDIWGEARKNGENDASYAQRIWTPILGDREKNSPKVVFSSGSLSGYSDWEFPIKAYAFDDSKTLDGVPSHWRLTLAKSDAEVDASGKWIPSIQTQAHAGDHFYFIGIDMPHQYVLWAEEEVDKWKRENMPSQIKPTYVVQTDKVRLNDLQEDETQPLLNSLRIGNTIRTADFRFIEGDYEVLHLQSVTYTWDASTIMLPNVEVVLSDKIFSSKDPISDFEQGLRRLKDSTLVAVATTTKLVTKITKEVKLTSTEAKTAQRFALQAQTSALEAQTQSKKLSTTIGGVNDKDTSIYGQLYQLSNRLTKVEENTGTTDLTALKTQVETNTSNIVTLGNRLSQSETKLVALETTQSTQGQMLVAIKTDVTNIDERVTNVEKRVAVRVVTVPTT